MLEQMYVVSYLALEYPRHYGFLPAIKLNTTCRVSGWPFWWRNSWFAEGRPVCIQVALQGKGNTGWDVKVMNTSVNTSSRSLYVTFHCQRRIPVPLVDVDMQSSEGDLQLLKICPLIFFCLILLERKAVQVAWFCFSLDSDWCCAISDIIATGLFCQQLFFR